MEKMMAPLRRSNRVAGASGAQIPFRRAVALRDSGRPCSSTQIQSQGAKRKYMSPCASWGAKRARSALGGGGAGDKQALSGSLPPPPHTNNRCVHLIHWAKRSRSVLGCGGQSAISVRPLGSGDGKPALSVGSLPRPNNSTSRDWADLGDGPAGLIAEFGLASGVADYVRFRSACTAWRRCSPDPRATGGLDSRFLPREWIMLDKAHAGPRCRRFLNISTGECVRMDLPELAEHRLLALTPEGLLLLLHEATLAVCLLNPLTRQLTDLPRLTGLLQARGYKSAGSIQVYAYSVGLVAEASTVAVCFFSPTVLAVAKPGDKNWTVVNNEYINATLPFAGRFYCATEKGVMVLDTTSDQQPPRLVMVAEISFWFSPMAHHLHLVDNGGELMLVHRIHGNYNHRKCDVYRVDFKSALLIPVKSFHGRTVFMGMRRTISIPAGVFPLVSADALYLGRECDREILGYNIADGSRIPRQCGPIPDGWVGPVNIIDCLCKCIQGIGDLLA